MADFRFFDAVSQAIAQLVIDKVDAGAGPGTIKFMTRSMGTWAASKVYAVGDSVYMAGRNYDCTTAGTSGGSAPTWPTSGTVADGSVVWTEGGDAGADTLLGTLTCADPAGVASGKTLTFSTIAQDDSADTGGKARRAVVADSDGTGVIELSVTGVAGSGPAKLNTQTVIAGGPIRLNAFVLTTP